MRINSIFCSNLRRRSSNKAQSNGKIKVLNVWGLQHYSSGLLNGVLSGHDNSTEPESNWDGNRSPSVSLSLTKVVSGEHFRDSKRQVVTAMPSEKFKSVTEHLIAENEMISV